MYATIEFNWNDAANELTISDHKGEFPGILKNRKFEIVVVNEKSGTGMETSAKSRSVKYNGKQIEVSL